MLSVELQDVVALARQRARAARDRVQSQASLVGQELLVAACVAEAQALELLAWSIESGEYIGASKEDSHV